MNNSVAFDIRAMLRSSSSVLPEIMYVDANAVLDVLNERRNGLVNEQFWDQLKRRGGLIVWSGHMIDEVWDTIHVDEYVKYVGENSIYENVSRQGNPGKNTWKIAEDRVTAAESASIAQKVIRKVNSIKEKLGHYGLQLDSIPENEISEYATFLYGRFGGNRKDALHVAYMNLNEINSIHSGDPGLLRYPNQNVYGASVTLASKAGHNSRPVPYLDFSELIYPKAKLDEKA